MRQGAVAADDDERVEAQFVEILDTPIRVVDFPVAGRERIGKRIAAVGGPEDGAAKSKDAGDVAQREQPGAFGIDQAVETVFESDALDPGRRRRLDDGADDGVQSRRVTAAGQDTNSSDGCRHGRALV